MLAHLFPKIQRFKWNRFFWQVSTTFVTLAHTLHTMNKERYQKKKKERIKLLTKKKKGEKFVFEGLLISSSFSSFPWNMPFQFSSYYHAAEGLFIFFSFNFSLLFSPRFLFVPFYLLESEKIYNDKARTIRSLWECEKFYFHQILRFSKIFSLCFPQSSFPLSKTGNLDSELIKNFCLGTKSGALEGHKFSTRHLELAFSPIHLERFSIDILSNQHQKLWLIFFCTNGDDRLLKWYSYWCCRKMKPHFW